MPAGDADRASFAARLRALRADVVRQVDAEPAVSAVTLSAALPGLEPYAFFEIDEGAPGARPITRYPSRANLVDAAFLEVFDVPLLAGRTFDAGGFGAARTAIVGRTFAQQVVGEGNALGRRVRLSRAPGAEAGPWYRHVCGRPRRPRARRPERRASDAGASPAERWVFRQVRRVNRRDRSTDMSPDGVSTRRGTSLLGETIEQSVSARRLQLRLAATLAVVG
jgi:hypothetical protein